MADEQRIACLRFGASGAPMDEKDQFALAEACLRFSPRISLRPGEAVFIEIGGSRGLFSEKSFSERALALARRFRRAGAGGVVAVPGPGIAGAAPCVAIATAAPRVAIANDAPTALALAREGAARREQLSLAALHAYASPFAHDPDAYRKVEKALALLENLGVRTLGEFLALPHASLASRFGRELVDLASRAHGLLPVAWPGFRPEERVSERSDPGAAGVGNPESIEALLFLFRAILDRAMARLRGRCERASVIRVGFELEKWSGSEERREWLVEFPVPQGSVTGIIPILRDQLFRRFEREPLTAPVQAVWVDVLETAPGRGAQRDFFSRKEEEDEALGSLFARLAQKIGKDGPFVARALDRYLPEQGYERAVSAGPGAGSASAAAGLAAFPERPARLLRRPEPVRVFGSEPGERVLSHRSRRWRVVSVEGPERLSGEWWANAAAGGFDRDYYRLTVESGEKLWVFVDRAGKGDALFLHGYFD